MAKKVDIGPKITLEGEKEFRKALTSINSDMRVLGSEMKKVSASFQENQNSLEALTEKDRVLTQEIEKQKQKIDVLKTLKINSPSKVFKELGAGTGEGFNIGVTDSMQIAKASLENQVKQMTGIKPAEISAAEIETRAGALKDQPQQSVNEAADKIASGDLTLNLTMPNGEVIFSTVYKEFRKKKCSDSTLSMA